MVFKTLSQVTRVSECTLIQKFPSAHFRNLCGIPHVCDTKLLNFIKLISMLQLKVSELSYIACFRV